MLRGLSIIIAMVLISHPTLADEKMFDDLSSSDFEVREKAQVVLEQWASERKDASIAPLLHKYKEVTSPEAKGRIESVLKKQVILKRYGAGPGFVGIQMRDDRVQLNGKVIPAVGVTDVVENSAAQEAGIKVGDLIVSVDKVKFEENNLGRVRPSMVFSNYVKTKTANDVVDLKMVRNGQLMDVKVTLMAMPEKVRVQQMELNLPNLGVRQEEKEKYFQLWLLRELQK